MPRPVSNPPNPWETLHVEWLGPPPEARLEVLEERAKSIVTENRSPDVPFRYGVNPYRGCQHACAYCYARPTHSFIGLGAGTDFDKRIVVKTNTPELLQRELSRPSWSGESITFSGVTDCYQPLEASYRLTRRCLEVCRRLRNPVAVITKSALVRRDVDLLAELSERADARVYLSIPLADPDLARRLEPGAPTPKERFEALRELSSAGIRTGVAVAPLIPGLGERDVPEVLERAREAGARDAFLTLLRLSEEVEPVFRDRLRESLPGSAERVFSALSDMRGGRPGEGRFGHRMVGTGPRWEAVRRLFDVQCRRLGLSTRAGPETEPPPRRPRPRQGELFQQDAGIAPG